MNTRRDFITGLFNILPAAVCYKRIWHEVSKTPTWIIVETKTYRVLGRVPDQQLLDKVNWEYLRTRMGKEDFEVYEFSLSHAYKHRHCGNNSLLFM